MYKERIGITGIGVVSAHGAGKVPLWQALYASQIPEIGKNECLEIPYYKMKNKYSAMQMAQLAIMEALEDANLQGVDFPLVYAWSKEIPNQILNESFFELVQNPSLFSKQCDWKGSVIGMNTACVSGINAVYTGLSLLLSENVDIVIVGAMEEELPDFLIAAYKNMQVLHSPSSDTISFCPFDQDASGFMLSQGAAFFVLEKESSIRKRNAKVWAWIKNMIIMNEAYHMTRLNPDGMGVARLIERVLGNDWTETNGYVNCHGTATRSNDLAEIRGLNYFFKNNDKISISATKPVTGHALGASSALEIAIICWCLQSGWVPPTIYLKNLIEKSSLDFVFDQGKPIDLNWALSLSYGFGGHLAGILLQKR